MAYLTRLRQPTVIACTIRGKTGGTRALCQGHRSYRTRHTFCRQQPGEFTANVAVCRVYSSAKRTGRHVRQAGWMVFVLIRLGWSPLAKRAASTGAVLASKAATGVRVKCADGPPRPTPRTDSYSSV